MYKEEARIKECLKRSDVVFVEDTHRYLRGEEKLKGITSTLLKFAYPNTYKTPDNMSEEQWQETLKKAADKGTAVHNDIQNYCENGTPVSLPEGESWVATEFEYDIEWIENEYLVEYDEFASKIDILANVGNELSIIDIKRTQTIHYEEVALQTSIYKFFFEKMNPKMEIKHLYVFWARGKEYKLIELPIVDVKDIKALITAYRNGDEGYEFNPMPKWANKSLFRKLRTLTAKKKAIEAEIDLIKVQLLEGMENGKYKALSFDGVKVEYIAPTIATTFDKKTFEKENPGVLENYQKESKKNSYIKISVSDE